MMVVYFILAVLFLTFAHFFKVARQKQFIEIYEKPNDKILLKALSFGYIINMIFPIKLGYIFRIFYPGKRMKNGVSFSFATIVIDIILDFLIVTILYAILYLGNLDVFYSLKCYILITCILLFIMVIAFFFSKYIKKVILKLASIFNENLELKILKTFWFTITSFKDMLQKINKCKLIFYTIVPWTLYLGSYYSFSLCMQQIGLDLTFINIINMFYSISSISIPSLFSLNNYGTNIIVLILYIVLPLLLIYLFALVYIVKDKKKEYIEILPHINMQDRLAFLVAYFNANDRDYFKNYLDLNSDVAIIEDFSAGSNATTMLCSKKGETFFRKYSFGKDAKKLYEQTIWLQDHQKQLNVTKVENVKYSENYCSYDMPYNVEAITCFNYVHTVPIEKSWPIIKKVLDDLNSNLYTLNKRKSDNQHIENYVNAKVLDNIKKIESAFYLKPILKYDYVFINGKKYRNLKYFYKYLNKEFLVDLFKNDIYSDIHGDLTIENIICTKNALDKKKDAYYIIDPNTGNIHESCYLDYAKLLQSIHGGYEFLMNTKNVNIYENKIDFIFTRSLVYDELYSLYKNYLENKFSKSELKSIFFHEIIHWLRLMPYKIEKNGKRAIIFYAGLIMVLNDVEEMHFEKRIT